MTRKIETTCDHCGANLDVPTPSGPCGLREYDRLVTNNYYLLELRSQTRALRVMGVPPLPNDLHFCTLGCLIDWARSRDRSAEGLLAAPKNLPAQVGPG